MIIGLFICNNSAIYLEEIEKTAHYNGSFSLAILYFIIFFTSLIFFDNFYSKKLKYKLTIKSPNKSYNYIYILFFIVGLFLYLYVFNKPSFNLNVDRFNYSLLYLPKWILSLQNNFVYAIPIILFPVILKSEKINKRNVKKILLSIIPFLLYSIWTGNKFGMFLNIILLLLSPICIYINLYPLKNGMAEKLIINEQTSKSKSIKKIFISAIIVLVILLAPYYFLRGLDFGDSMINRAAQQGQLFWATFEIEENNGMHIDELSDEIHPIKKTIQKKGLPDTYGIYKIMKITTPYNRYLRKLSTGSRYSAQGIEIAFYYFKYFGVIFHAILRAFFEALLVNMLIKYVFSCKYIHTFIVSRLILINHYIFTQGDIYRLFTRNVILLVVILLCLILLEKRSATYGKKNK